MKTKFWDNVFCKNETVNLVAGSKGWQGPSCHGLCAASTAAFQGLVSSCAPRRAAIGLILLLILAAFSRTSIITAAENKNSDPQITAFLVEKRAQIESTAKAAGRPVPKLVQDFFAAVQRADWDVATNAAEHALRFGESGGAESEPDLWQDFTRLRQPLMEALGVAELAREMNPKFFRFLGQELTKSIPAGSIYFGGSDEGRFLPTLFSQSQLEGRPFFTLTQNALADGTYLTYLDEIYGKKIGIANSGDSQRCFQEYLNGAQRRLAHDRKFPGEPRQLAPGEDVKIVDNRVQVSGMIAVMPINGLLVKTIFDKNPDRDFYIEESYPIDWMYPYLTPHQFIFKLNRKPLTGIPPDLVQANRQLWTKQIDVWLGPWLRTNTPLAQVMDFAERVYQRKDLKKFQGDPQFVNDRETQKAFARMRAAAAGLFAWHGSNAKDETERQRMEREADYAFRQAVAIGPASPDAVARYANRLADNGSLADALRLARLAAAIDPDEEKLRTLVQEINQRPAPSKRGR